MLRNLETFKNYTVTEMNEHEQAQQDRELDDAKFASKMKEREVTVVHGLITKYGFSENGAKATMNLIKKSGTGCDMHGHAFVASAKFATPEMKSAAMKAFEYYWK